MNELDYRLKFALPVQDQKRVYIRGIINGIAEVILDVHGLKCKEAKKMINNLLNIVRQKIKLIVIHGFHGGTAIRDMLPRIANKHIIDVKNDEYNTGKTYILAA